MPRGDGSGPIGMGPMIRRKAGYFRGNNAPGLANKFPGRGLHRAGRGWFGCGRGRQYIGYDTRIPEHDAFTYASRMTPEQDIDYLKEQAQYLQDALEGIKKQIDTLESRSGK